MRPLFSDRLSQSAEFGRPVSVREHITNSSKLQKYYC